MPITVAATVTLYMVRILKPLFRQIALPYATSCEFRAGVISEFLRAEKGVESVDPLVGARPREALSRAIRSAQSRREKGSTKTWELMIQALIGAIAATTGAGLGYVRSRGRCSDASALRPRS